MSSNLTPTANIRDKFHPLRKIRNVVTIFCESPEEFATKGSANIIDGRRGPVNDILSDSNISYNVFMKLGIILQSNKPEHVWNTFRLGITALKTGHRAEIFLMNEGSELNTIPDSKDFDIAARVAEFKELKGEIYACGTCLKIRGKEESGVCLISTMSDLLKMVEGSDKVLVFG